MATTLLILPSISDRLIALRPYSLRERFAYPRMMSASRLDG